MFGSRLQSRKFGFVPPNSGLQTTVRGAPRRGRGQSHANRLTTERLSAAQQTCSGYSLNGTPGEWRPWHMPYLPYRSYTSGR
ncbi:Protein of unknown function [Gryllus bimaculatus]|nr:Protein of unknown function [Gryllus bimaculatus]